MQIVIAWTVAEVEIVRARRIDLGEHPVTRAVQSPRAAMWLNAGTQDDLRKARDYATREGYAVFTYVGEREPLARARREILLCTKSAERKGAA